MACGHAVLTLPFGRPPASLSSATPSSRGETSGACEEYGGEITVVALPATGTGKREKQSRGLEHYGSRIPNNKFRQTNSALRVPNSFNSLNSPNSLNSQNYNPVSRIGFSFNESRISNLESRFFIQYPVSVFPGIGRHKLVELADLGEALQTGEDLVHHLVETFAGREGFS